MIWTMKKAHKFGAIRTEKDGISFPSRLEKRYYDHLNLLKQAGKVVFFIRQPSFDVAYGVKYVADFLVFYSDGSCEIVDVKGAITKEFALKKKLLEERYPFELKIVTAKDF